MLSSLFPVLYSVAAILLLWQAFRVIGRALKANEATSNGPLNNNRTTGDRTGRLTIHPELLDPQGRITDEELLTVRFSGEIDPPQSAETSAE